MLWNTPLTRLKMEIFPLIFPSLLLHLLPDKWQTQAWQGGSERGSWAHWEPRITLCSQISRESSVTERGWDRGKCEQSLTSWRHWRRCDVAGGNVALLRRPVRSNGLENPRSPVQYHPGAYYWCCIKHWLRLFKAQLERGKKKVEGRTWCSTVFFFAETLFFRWDLL